MFSNFYIDVRTLSMPPIQMEALEGHAQCTMLNMNVVLVKKKSK
jgi:hypothetical protein